MFLNPRYPTWIMGPNSQNHLCLSTTKEISNEMKKNSGPIWLLCHRLHPVHAWTVWWSNNKQVAWSSEVSSFFKIFVSIAINLQSLNTSWITQPRRKGNGITMWISKDHHPSFLGPVLGNRSSSVMLTRMLFVQKQLIPWELQDQRLMQRKSLSPLYKGMIGLARSRENQWDRRGKKNLRPSPSVYGEVQQHSFFWRAAFQEVG